MSWDKNKPMLINVGKNDFLITHLLCEMVEHSQLEATAGELVPSCEI
jgi:hypothetical protein